MGIPSNNGWVDRLGQAKAAERSAAFFVHDFAPITPLAVSKSMAGYGQMGSSGLGKSHWLLTFPANCLICNILSQTR